jgi:hypothetical protein
MRLFREKAEIGTSEREYDEDLELSPAVYLDVQVFQAVDHSFCNVRSLFV